MSFPEDGPAFPSTVRTADSRFAGLPDSVFAGLRAISIDPIGVGRSDKLTQPSHYTFEGHIARLEELVDGLDRREITLVCQDWGGPVALGSLARQSDRFERVVAGDTMLHTTESDIEGRIALAIHSVGAADQLVGGFLLDWMRHAHRPPDFSASPSIQGATCRDLSPWKAFASFKRPFLTLFGDSDPSTQGWDEIFWERVPDAVGQPHQTLENTGHFWQEDCGAEAAQIIVDWIRSTPL